MKLTVWETSHLLKTVTRSICPTSMLTTLRAWRLLWRHRGFWTESCWSANVFQWKMGAKWQFVRCPPGRFHRCVMLNSVPQGFGFEESIKHKRQMMAKCWKWPWVSASGSIQLISNVFWICLHTTEYCDKGYANRSLTFIFIMVIITVTKHFDKL